MNRSFVLTVLMLAMCLSVSVKPMFAQDTYAELTDQSGVTAPALVEAQNILPISDFILVTEDPVEYAVSLHLRVSRMLPCPLTLQCFVRRLLIAAEAGIVILPASL